MAGLLRRDGLLEFLPPDVPELPDVLLPQLHTVMVWTLQSACEEGTLAACGQFSRYRGMAVSWGTPC